MENIKLFLVHIGLFSGGLFWVVIFTVLLGNYQVGWKSPTGYTETVVNQVNEESLMRQTVSNTMAQQGRDAKGIYRNQ